MTFSNKEDNIEQITKIVTDAFKEVTTSYIEQLSKLEAEHWKQLEKQSAKQLVILEKQTKDFMGVMKDFIEASKPVPQPVPQVTELISNLPERENSIAKEEVEEQHLEDIQRIPLVDGVNVQFEGNDELFPINIS